MDVNTTPIAPSPVPLQARTASVLVKLAHEVALKSGVSVGGEEGHTTYVLFIFKFYSFGSLPHDSWIGIFAA